MTYICYIKELKTIPEIKNYDCSVKEETLILSKYGLQKISKNDLYLYKISNNLETANFKIDKYNFLINKNPWIKKCKFLRIPYEYDIIKMQKFEYLINTKLKFIIEKINNNINDFYFVSHGEPFLFKNNISSFLSQLK